MKLLILTCLVAVALARPKHPLRHPELIQNQPGSSEEILKERKFSAIALATPIELRQEYINELNREQHVITETEQSESSSSSSSEEVASQSSTEPKCALNEDVTNQCNQVKIH
ncbi:alpha-S1-casein [Microcebus murinus]|uniref:alpha-S1-casein n=1 Tax=Microcebus murinus TaxID=30608 RepID=UPI003F6B36BA